MHILWGHWKWDHHQIIYFYLFTARSWDPLRLEDRTTVLSSSATLMDATNWALALLSLSAFAFGIWVNSFLHVFSTGRFLWGNKTIITLQMINFLLHLGQSFRIVVILYQKAAQVCCAAHHTLADDAFIRRIGWTPLLLQWSQRLGHKSTWMSWTKWKCRKEAHVPYASWRITWIGMRGEGKHVSIHDCIFLLEASDILQQSFPTGIRTCEIMQGGPLPAINGPMSPRLEWRYDCFASFFSPFQKTFHAFKGKPIHHDR